MIADPELVGIVRDDHCVAEKTVMANGSPDGGFCACGRPSPLGPSKTRTLTDVAYGKSVFQSSFSICPKLHRIFVSTPTKISLVLASHIRRPV